MFQSFGKLLNNMPDTRPANELNREEYAARAGVPVSQITGTFGNFMVGPATPAPLAPPAPPEQTAEQLAAARIANANAYTPPTDPYQQQLEAAYGGVSGILTAPQETEEQIRQQTRTSMQAYIDAVNAEYAAIIAREEEAGRGRLERGVGMARAISARRGTLGEPGGESFIETTRGEIETKTRGVVEAYQREKGARLAKAEVDIQQMTKDEIRARKAEAIGYMGELEKVRTANRDKAIETAKLLSPDDLKNMPEDKYKALLNATGWSATTLEKYAAANAKGEISDFTTKIQGNSLITSWWNKKTGKPEIKVEDLGQYGVTGDQYDRSSFDEKTGQLLLWNEKTGTSKVVKPGGYVPVPPVPTETEKNKALKKQAITLARPALEASKRGGEFIDGNEFLRLRNDWAEAIGDTSDFDEIFGPQLSPTDRAKYGIGKATGVKAVEEITNGVKAVEEITNPFE